MRTDRQTDIVALRRSAKEPKEPRTFECTRKQSCLPDVFKPRYFKDYCIIYYINSNTVQNIVKNTVYNRIKISHYVHWPILATLEGQSVGCRTP
jgi:hypothetical protein